LDICRQFKDPESAGPRIAKRPYLSRFKKVKKIIHILIEAASKRISVTRIQRTVMPKAPFLWKSAFSLR